MTNRALLAVDMQNGFCHPNGSFSQIGMGLEGAQDAVRNAAIAVARARRAAIPVVFTRHVYRPGRADEGGALIRNSSALAGIAVVAPGPPELGEAVQQQHQRSVAGLGGVETGAVGRDRPVRPGAADLDHGVGAAGHRAHLTGSCAR